MPNGGVSIRIEIPCSEPLPLEEVSLEGHSMKILMQIPDKRHQSGLNLIIEEVFVGWLSGLGSKIISLQPLPSDHDHQTLQRGDSGRVDRKSGILPSG